MSAEIIRPRHACLRLPRGCGASYIACRIARKQGGAHVFGIPMVHVFSQQAGSYGVWHACGHARNLSRRRRCGLALYRVHILAFLRSCSHFKWYMNRLAACIDVQVSCRSCGAAKIVLHGLPLLMAVSLSIRNRCGVGCRCYTSRP